MLLVLSPAKTLDYVTPAPVALHQLPQFRKDAMELITRLRELSAADIASLMAISAPLARENAERYQRFSPRYTHRNAKQALFAFNGSVYQGLEPRSLNELQINFAQDHVRILSGLYGVLRPLDLIQPYRLEMGTRLSNTRGADLYEFWGSRIARQLSRELVGRRYPVLVNLASDEYFRSVDISEIQAPILKIVFEEDQGGGQTKVIGVLAKRARGLMTRYTIENRLQNPERLKEFNAEGYQFVPASSSEWQWVFRRDPDALRR